MGLAVLVFLLKVRTVYKSQLIKLLRRNNDTHRHVNRKKTERERERAGVKTTIMEERNNERTQAKYKQLCCVIDSAVH